MNKVTLKVLAGGLMVWLAGSVLADDAAIPGSESLNEDLSRYEKSTPETIRFKPLEGEALADTAIEGALDAPAAGESLEVPDVLKEGESLDDAAPDQSVYQDRRFIPVKFDLRPRMQPVEGRTYNQVYRTRQY